MLVPVVGAQFLAARGRLLGPERLVDGTMAWTMCDPTRIDPELRRRLVELSRTRGLPEAAAACTPSRPGLFWYLTRNMRGDEARVTLHADRPRRPGPARPGGSGAARRADRVRAPR
jgi:hypothetical protein